MTQALVLAGGGVTGVAWETGVLLGLRDAGHDIIGHLDLVVGTSAGSTVGAQILSGTDLALLFARQTADKHNEISPQLDLDALATIFGEMALGGTTTDEQRSRVGELALGSTTVDEATRRGVIEKRLPSHEWPTTPLILTAIDAVTGEFVTWDKDSGVSLVDAVTSSCAVPSVWPCVTINKRRYYDGGLRNTANAYLATGYTDVIVIAPMTSGPSPIVNVELDDLRASGSTLRIVVADAEAVEAMGPNSLDPGFRRVAAEHGRRQGRIATF
ncbi:MAG: patatin [Acidimicrobium sp.]|nr:patatin-like phospholipase family protein [Ilumatobacteraceae bacterium]PHX73214.1 MAG: patatin [Acidimicrobium sp.]